MTRVDAACLCGSNKLFTKCCSRFLDGSQHAKTPEQLMRSRYTAYALGGHGDYLLQTWFPATARGLVAAELSEPSHDWCKLEVLGTSQTGDNGEVTFRAHYREADGTPGVMQECSVFKRLDGRWYYVDGQVS
jgi:SEC-C motif-containing protein